ncbi:hypothetical protein COLU111180_20785 [Cohnella lubricantis]|uniref:Uncharacterized protein n=1 Tax=Cohnella lubricantis TaxID=2163172 RepID=A0A841T8J2_9BACL|nr:hypothetical protein [Cohnella lubricantis]MBB6677823.1 hypothetical protein [Cohnella lubricantis]MBP2120502.1 hypothetical protein [Cohnella lubricantis]
MKQLLLTSLIIVLLTACQRSSPSEPAAVASAPAASSDSDVIRVEFLPTTDNEYTVMKAAGASHAMIFTINHFMRSGGIELWMEHYVDGQLHDSVNRFTSYVADNVANNKIYFSIQRISDEEQRWTFAVRQGDNLASAQANVLISNQTAMVSTPLNDVEMTGGDATALGTIVVSEEDTPLSASTDIEATIRQNKEVYVLKCKASEDNAGV